MSLTYHLSDEDYCRAERNWRTFIDESLNPTDLATEIDYWVRQLGRWQGDLRIGDFQYCDEAAVRGGIAYAEQRLADLTRQANRYERAKTAPTGVGHRQDDLRPRFAAAKYADLVGIAETFGYAPRKRGANYLMRCPFHPGDETPSLTIYPIGRGWYCFGCGKGGSDAASFVAEHFRCSAIEALHLVEQLATTYPECWGAAS